MQQQTKNDTIHPCIHLYNYSVILYYQKKQIANSPPWPISRAVRMRIELFCKRELTFRFTVVIVNPSVTVCLSVCNVRASRTPPPGERERRRLNAQEVAKYSDLGPFEGYMSFFYMSFFDALAGVIPCQYRHK